MSRSLRRTLASMLARQLVRTAPPSRVIWAEAMQRELAEIEDPGEALRFGIGCFRACAMERMRSLDLALRLARRLMVAATALFAVLGLLVAARLFPVHAPNAMLIGGISAAFALASLLLARCGPSASAAVAAAMLVPSACGLAGWPVAMPGAQHAALYRALALEGLTLWSLLLAGSFALAWATHSAWLRNLAREKGWA